MSQVFRRKEAKQQKPINWRSFIEIAFLLGVLIVIGIVGYNLYVIIKEPNETGVPKLVINGERRLTTNDDVTQIITSLGQDKSYLSYDVNEIKNSLQTLSWIKETSVSKAWPDLLKINIVEFKPVFYWNDNSFLDEDGNVFFIPEDRVNNDEVYPSLYGPLGTEKDVLNMFNTLKNVLKNMPYLTINQLSVDERYSWDIVINNQLNIELGREDVEKRLLRFADLYHDIVQPQIPSESIIYIDMRYDSGMAIRKG